LYGYLYQQSEKNFVIIHALDGYDEVSLTGPVKIITDRGERLLEPSDFGMEKVKPEELSGGTTVEDAAKILTDVLVVTSTETQKNVVIANAGLGIYAARPELSLGEAVDLARGSLESGKALGSFNKLIN
jgi:anthranilate phosphoribosyltransferase